MTKKHEKLDPYYPPQKAITGVRQQLLTAGVEAENLPETWIPAVLAAAAKWMQTTEDGLEYAARLFHFEFERGKDTEEYALTYYEKCHSRDFCLNLEHCMPNGTGRQQRCLRELQPVVKPVKPSDVYFFQGCIAEREPVPVGAIARQTRDREGCDLCTATLHCVKKLEGAYSKTITSLCNHCRSFSENPQIRAEGDPWVCEACTATKCNHHPRKGLDR